MGCAGENRKGGPLGCTMGRRGWGKDVTQKKISERGYRVDQNLTF
jgi:hypothetical protein